MGFMVVGDGTPIPWRVRARSSSFCNLSVMRELCRGCLIADMPAVLGSLDIVLGGDGPVNDRMSSRMADFHYP